MSNTVKNIVTDNKATEKGEKIYSEPRLQKSSGNPRWGKIRQVTLLC